MGWTHHAEQFERLAEEKALEDLLSEPEAPAKCHSCGGSIYLNDRDDDGLCDPCWEKAEKVSFDEAEDQRRKAVREAIERDRKIAGGGF